MTDERRLDAVFLALGHETRRQILDLVRARPGAGVGEIAAEFDVSRIAVMKHLRALEDAELIVSQKDGRTRRLYFNVVPIQMIYERWADDYDGYWAGKLTLLKARAEAAADQPARNKRAAAPTTIHDNGDTIDRRKNRR